jgi:hypothetical protein
MVSIMPWLWANTQAGTSSTLSSSIGEVRRISSCSRVVSDCWRELMRFNLGLPIAKIFTLFRIEAGIGTPSSSCTRRTAVAPGSGSVMFEYISTTVW